MYLIYYHCRILNRIKKMIKEDFKSLISNDQYLVKRQDVSYIEKAMYLRETNFKCPLCGKDLLNRKQKKYNALFEIAHIYPNRPTQEQYNTLKGLDRLGKNCESFENKIALCLDCHDTQDFRTTKEEYLKLLEIKKELLKNTLFNTLTTELSLESEIEEVLQKLQNLNEEELVSLNYSPVKLSKKFSSNEYALNIKVSAYVTRFYPYIRDILNSLDGTNHFDVNVLCLQIKTAFTKLTTVSKNKEEIFNQLVKWIQEKTCSNSLLACEVVISFFIQNCEVFNEITE